MKRSFVSLKAESSLNLFYRRLKKRFVASNKTQPNSLTNANCFFCNQQRLSVFIGKKRTLQQPLHSRCLRGSECGGDGGGGRVTVVGRSTGSSMGRTRRVPLMATSCSAADRSSSAPSSNRPPPVLAVEERWRLTVREPLASVLTVTSAYIELTLVSFRMKSESSSWSWPSFWSTKTDQKNVNLIN